MAASLIPVAEEEHSGGEDSEVVVLAEAAPAVDLEALAEDGQAAAVREEVGENLPETIL